MGPLGQPQRGVRAATGNAADMWGGAVSEAQRALERGRELGRVRGRKRAGRGLGFAWERGSAGSGRAGRLGRLGFGSLGLVYWVLGFLSISYLFSLLFPIQQTQLKPFEFKFKFEFSSSTQTNKTMHQHECSNKVYPKENFN